MARSFTKAVLRGRARFHADLENSNRGVLDARVDELLDVHAAEVYRELVKVGSPDYYSLDQPYTTSNGTVSYPLPTDYFKSVRAFRVLDANRRFPLEEIDGDLRAYFQPPSGAFSVVLEYIPAPPDISTAADGTTFDGIAGYEEYICKLVAVDLLRKEKTAADALRAECAEIKRQIARTAKRSTGGRLIQDREEEGFDQYWYVGASSGVRAYRIRAGNVEFYERRALP